MGDHMSAEEQFINEDGTPATWLEDVPPHRRKAAFIRWIGIALVLSALLAVLLFSNGRSVVDWIDVFAWILGPGLLVGVLAYSRKEIRQYSTQKTSYSNLQRLRRAGKWWAWGCVMVALVWGFQISEGKLAERWWYAWPSLLFFLVGAGLYRLKYEVTLTPAAAKAKAYFDQPQNNANQLSERAEPAQWEKVLDGFVKHVDDSPWLRFPLACAFVAGAIYFGTLEYRHAWVLVVACALLAVTLAREFVIWAMGAAFVCAVGWAFFAGVSELPVSAAIIIGAIIIANAAR